MRIALISDIHGNLPALEAVLADIDSKNVDRIICLGDIVDLGPQPREVLHRIRSLNIPCVQGNHDPLTEEPPPLPILQKVLEKNRGMLDEVDMKYLRELPAFIRIEIPNDDNIGNKEKQQRPIQLLCVHGSPRSNTENLTADLSDAEMDGILLGEGDEDEIDFDVLACGHTHVQMVRRWRGRTVLNVGSVGLPFERVLEPPKEPKICPWAEYALLECTGSLNSLSLELRRVPYDLGSYRDALVEMIGATDAESWLG